ncbi:MAG TPA: M56 family metallopeptidase, partial [Dehalococcoidia bacterium]|nr:M56 family metallopeptidase [Dehalococcoidia bacterium]
MTRSVDSFAALLLVSGAALLELGAAVLTNAWLLSSGPSAAATLVRTCVLLLSLHVPGVVLIVVWVLLALLLGWCTARLLWETASRWQRTRRSVAGLRDALVLPLPSALAHAISLLSLEGRAELIERDESLSLCYGLAEPRILLSTGLLQRLDGPQLEAVLLHERAHLLGRDPLRLLLAHSLAAALRWIPLIPALAERSLTEQEVLADRAAVEAQSGPQHLASAMLKLLARADGVPSLNGLAISSLSVSAARIEALARPE